MMAPYEEATKRYSNEICIAIRELGGTKAMTPANWRKLRKFIRQKVADAMAFGR